MRIGCTDTVRKRASIFLFLTFGMFFYSSSLLAAERQAGSSNQQKITEVKEPLVVELFFGDISVGIQLCYRSHNELWIPFELFQKHAHLPTLTESQSKVQIMTTLGPIDFDPRTLREFEGQKCISFTTLRETLHVHPLFNEFLYAIKILVPWKPLASVKQNRKKAVVQPDIPAPDNSLSFLHIESDISHSFHDDNTHNYLEFETGGRLGDGIWNIMAAGDPSDTFSISRYHWTTLNRHSALRIGTGKSQTYNLLNNLDYTGLQFAWNNRNILQNLDDDFYSDTDVLLNIDRTQRRNIEGTGPPAGIAELRFDGHVVARQRITFDGRFIFRNVRMANDLRITEVYIYERSLLEKPLHVIDYTRSVMNRSLAGNELLFHGAIGHAGTILDEESVPNSMTGFANVLYGLNERITLEGTLQYDPYAQSFDQLFGAVMSIGSRWNTALYTAHSNGHFGADVSVFGHGKTWRFSQRSLWQDKGYGYDEKEQRERHLMRLQAHPFSWLDAFIYGNYTKEDKSVTSRHLLPGGTLHLFPRTRISAIPNDSNGNYRYEVYLRPRRDTDMRLRYEDEVITADIDHDLKNGSKTLQLYHSYAPKNQTHASSIYFNWYLHNNRNNRLRFGASHIHGKFRFSGSWSRDINTGLSFTLSYHDRMFNVNGLSVDDSALFPDDTSRRSVNFYLSWDLGRSNNRFYPINRTAISHTRGGMAGSLKIMTDSKISQSSINDVAILLNGRKLGQRQVGGTFFVGNLRPGIYTVSVDTENLPLELVVEQQYLKVEVNSGTVTEVTIPVFAEYGVAGKVGTASERMFADTPVCILDAEGNTIKQAKTDRFGYYRVDGLRQGNYTARVTATKEDKTGCIAETNFAITNDFLFDIDIVVPESPKIRQ